MDYIVHRENELYHHGILGMKWGVRRYQNADGTLTSKGKARLSKYKEQQLKKTSDYYDKNRHSGLYGTSVKKGINSLDKRNAVLKTKIESAKINGNYKKEAKYTSEKKINESQIKTLKSMKSIELKKVKSLTYDQMMKEKVAVGRSACKDALLTIGVNAVLLPTTGFVYGSITLPQSVRSKTRANNWETKKK